MERALGASGFRRIAGVDEAGRGPLAGPIVAGAVVLAEPIAGLDDSKRLTPARREELYEAICNGLHCVGWAVIEPEAIDRLGIQWANYAAMAEAVGQIEPPPDFLLVDGFEIRGCSLPQKGVVKGDREVACIAAASIVAKVTRDRLMDDLGRRYPGYGFAQHKGYGTREHMAALQRLGPCPAHRRSFAPLAEGDMTGGLFDMPSEDDLT